jgi:centromere/kinetochore protein ZW10
LVGDYHNSVQVVDCAEKGAPGVCPPAGKVKGKGKAGGMAADDSEESFFSLPSCQVTVSVQKLVKMAHGTLSEACLAPPNCADVFLHTARDILNLFRALVPTIHADALENDPRLASLFHNDCIFIAHHMLTIGHQYRDR